MAAGLPAADIRARMERMYRPQKLIYDLTRRHYLIGRDRLVAGIAPPQNGAVLDLGCGTGRNLAILARRRPDLRLCGLDAADAMLEVARGALARAGANARATLLAGDAERADLRASFARPAGFDAVLCSYSLSIMDRPGAALERALAALAPAGTLHLVDFGPMAGLPGPLRTALRGWLARFGVAHRPELRALLAARPGRLETVTLGGGYAELLRFTPAA
jgi:S-adenosylmethionine-diacylgycerolhomoserine-N-methlytransferase